MEFKKVLLEILEANLGPVIFLMIAGEFCQLLPGPCNFSNLTSLNPYFLNLTNPFGLCNKKSFI